MNRFRLIRYERGLTITTVAEEAGIGVRTLQRLEGDDGGQPTAPVVKALADYYGMTVAELLGIEEKAA